MILVTGASGQLGQALRTFLVGRDVIFASSGDLNITDVEACRRLVGERGVRLILNTAAYTKVDKAESEEELAFAVNATGVGHLAKAAKENGAALIHVSTDYVFDGSLTRPYREDDVPNPQTVYGRSKLAGERLALEEGGKVAVLRTGWLYSVYGANFLKTMLRLGAERDTLGVVADQTGTPTDASHLARDMVRIGDMLLEEGSLQEVFHYADEGAATWYEFARTIMQSAGLACEVRPITTADYPTTARRPAYSVLDKSKLKRHFGIDINNWQDDLDSCIAMLKA